MLANHFVYSQNVVNILGPCIQLIILVGTQTNDTAVSRTGHLEFDSKFNSLKCKALELANLIIGHIYITPIASKMASTPYYIFCGSIGPLALISLLWLCVTRYDQLEKNIADDKLSDIFVYFMRLLCYMLEDNSYYPLFSENKQRLIMDVVLVLIRSTETEKEWMMTEPDNFVNLALDTCDKQSSDLCKTEAAKLLEALCDHIDGALTFTALFCCEAIRYVCRGGSVAELQNNAVLGPISAHSMFLLKSRPESILETCLMAMTGISYLTPKRADILYQHTIFT